MRALTWQGNENVQVTDVPDPRIQEPTDAIIKVTSTAICGSDLHLYGVRGPYLKPGDVLGHETMGIVEEAGPGVPQLRPGDRGVAPFNISCGSCWMCSRGLFAQCETTQVRSEGKGASLFGYTSLYGSVPGGQAQYLRVPQAHFGPIKVPAGTPDEQFLYLSDILPTAYQAVKYADVPEGGTLAVLGLGPVGQFCTRIARQLGVGRVIAVDPVPERRTAAARFGVLDQGERRNPGGPNSPGRCQHGNRSPLDRLGNEGAAVLGGPGKGHEQEAGGNLAAVGGDAGEWGNGLHAQRARRAVCARGRASGASEPSASCRKSRAGGRERDGSPPLALAGTGLPDLAGALAIGDPPDGRRGSSGMNSALSMASLSARSGSRPSIGPMRAITRPAAGAATQPAVA